MTSGPTLGNAPKLSNQELFDAIQVNIADIGDDKHLRELVTAYSMPGSLSFLQGDLNEFSYAVREDKLTQEQIVDELKKIAVNALKKLGKMRDVELSSLGADYGTARWAIIKHFYKIARNFGAQVELGAFLESWEKQFPHTEDPKEQTFQEQKEAAFASIDSNFPDIYASVTEKSGYEWKKVLEGSVQYVQDEIAGQKGPVSYFLGIAVNFQLSEGTREKRLQLLKEKLKPMVLEALGRDARRATKTVFEQLSKEMFGTTSSLKGKSPANIADEMINDAIRPRAKGSKNELREYSKLIYYWMEDPSEHGNVIELRQNLMHMAQAEWGPVLRRDNMIEGQLTRADKRIAADPGYFSGYVPKKAPVTVAAEPEQIITKPVKAVKAPLEQVTVLPVPSNMNSVADLVATGEGAGVHDIAAMRARIADKTKQSGFTTPKPAREPEPQLAPVLVEPDPVEPSPDSRHAKTLPPTHSRPVRPNIQIAHKDLEKTQPDLRKQAAARGGFRTWARRTVYAAMAALGIAGVAAGGSAVFKAQQTHDTTDNNTAPSAEVGGQKNVTPAATATNTEEAPVASTAPSSAASTAPAVAQNPPTAPTVDPKIAAPDTSTAAPEVAAELGSYSYGMGSFKGAKAFAGTASMVEGGVDATPFSPVLKTASWYQNQQKSAELLLKIYDSKNSRLDKDTVNFVKTNEKTLRDLASQTEFQAFKFKTNFEKHHTSQELNGSTGVYNTLLAFERVMDLYGGDTEKLAKDSALIKLSIGDKLNSAEQRYAKAILFKAAPSQNPVQNPAAPANNTNDQKNNTSQPDGGSTGFNLHQSPHNVAPGMIPANFVPAQGSAFASNEGMAKPDTLDVALNAFNNSRVAKTADKKIARDYRLAQEVAQHVRDEDRAKFDFEAQRRNRGFGTKIADYARYIWSGTTPEDHAKGIAGVGGIRGLFMTGKQRQAEFNKVADMLAAAESKKANTASVVSAAAVPAAPVVPEETLGVAPQTVAMKKQSEREAADEKIDKLLDGINAQLDAENAATEAQKAAAEAKKLTSRSDLDAKMEKLFARGKLMEAERGPLPAISFRKTYTVKASDKSIRFLLERQITLSDISNDAKEKGLAMVQEMISSNGAFIESYKMYPDGSRDLTLKDEWRNKLSAAAGIEIAKAV